MHWLESLENRKGVLESPWIFCSKKGTNPGNVGASTVATALKKVTIIYPRFAIILIKILLSTNDSSATAQTTPKIWLFMLAMVSAELSLKKTVFFHEKEKLNMLTQWSFLVFIFILKQDWVGCSFSLAQNPHLILNGAYPTRLDWNKAIRLFCHKVDFTLRHRRHAGAR